MTGIAFTVGALSNAYFAKHGPLLKGTVFKMINQDTHHALIHIAKQNETSGKWEYVYDRDGKDHANDR